MPTTITNLTITGISVQFANGQIVAVNVTYNMTGPAGEQWSGNHAWNLTPAESASAAATGFVTALVNKIAAVTGLTVATT